MKIAASLREEETWINAMNVNNNASLDDIPEKVNDINEHIKMEKSLEDDQCNNIIMVYGKIYYARSSIYR